MLILEMMASPSVMFRYKYIVSSTKISILIKRKAYATEKRNDAADVVNMATLNNNCIVKFDAFGFSVKDFLTRHILLRCDSSGDLYPVTQPSPVPHALLYVSPSTWHQHLGDPDEDVLRSLVSYPQPSWVKLHGVFVTTCSDDGLSAIATKLEECPNNINTCAIKNLKKTSQTPKGIPVGHKMGFKPKQVFQPVSKNTTTDTCGKKTNNSESTKEVSKLNPFEVLTSVDNDVDLSTNKGISNSANEGTINVSSSNTHIAEKIDKIERKIREGKLRFVDDDGNPLVPTGIVDSDSEVKVVFDETANLRLSTSGKDGSDKGYGINSLLEQWRDSYPDNDDYDPYVEDMYENHDMFKHLQSICDDLNITPNPRFHGRISYISPLPKYPVVALSDSNCRYAMYDEYNALIRNSTWILVSKPPNTNMVMSMWLFRHKYHVDGSLSRYKARLIANGRSQQYGVDCDDTFSPVVKPTTICTVLSLALSHNWRIHQLDVKNAFLNGDLSKIVYMHLMFGFNGLRDMHYELDLLQCITSSLHKEFDMIDLGALNYFLGISVTRNSIGMFLSPKKYAIELLDREHMTTCNPTRTPVDTESKLGADGDPVSDPTLYRSLACGLQYLTFTRPNISYVVQQVCLYIHDPREPYFSAFKRILRYVHGMLDFGLQLYASSTRSLVAYSDADWAGYPTTMRYTLGYCVFLRDSLLSWSAKQQHTLSRLSVEAEYRGAANVVAETTWLPNLLRELHMPLSFATLIYSDNVSAIYLTANLV
uniref:Uncharacterized mitochondrial protein AtMg00810-like n=1 Tax=Tanacetum cinerariifolium TaxID=118510 RepID=A0A6L2M9I6_TANCI|nr:uncharacterized mitochondrial protein AtMg00810-like [Tanacetum cinerariifolium]